VAAYETGHWAATRKWVVRHRALAIALAAAVLSLTAGLVAALHFRDVAVARSGDFAREADRARASESRARARAEEVLSLSAAADVRDLVRDADLLWPLTPEILPKLEAWMARAETLVDGDGSGRPSREDHRARLAALRARARPRTPELRDEDRRSKPEYAAWMAAEARLRWQRERTLGLETWPSEDAVRPSVAELLRCATASAFTTVHGRSSRETRRSGCPDGKSKVWSSFAMH
jgi:hypothetical protein